MSPTFLQLTGTVLFAVAILHTFTVGIFRRWASIAPEGSVRENVFHFLGEIEVVFGLWAAVFLAVYSMVEGFAVYDEGHRLVGGAVHYLESRQFSEALFVFVIMAVTATRPVIYLAQALISRMAAVLPLPPKMAYYVTVLVVGPLLGSVLTEPAAMTVTALLLLDRFYQSSASEKFKYATLGLLFVNISVGGTLTHFAAPPVLMVANKYGWDTSFMLAHFGWKAAIAVVLSTALYSFWFRKELNGPLSRSSPSQAKMVPAPWVCGLHLVFLALIIMTSHHPVFFIGVFLFFIGFVAVTGEYQDELKLKEALLVGFFLAGLVTLGSIQEWWLQFIFTQLNDLAIYMAATGLTAITDNAALTYLGSLVPLSDSAKYSLVAGAVSGGGLTLIANAPNPAGYGLLKDRFSEGIVDPLKLFLAALVPTLIICSCFLFLPN